MTVADVAQQPRDVYTGPGLWEGCVVVPVVGLVAAIAAIVVGVTGTPSSVPRVGIAATVVGIFAWIGLWETFSRLHPRFGTGRGERLKYALVMGGPPVLALVAAVMAR